MAGREQTDNGEPPAGDTASAPSVPGVVFRLCPPVGNGALNSLFAAAWSEYADRDWEPVLSRSLAYVCAYTPDGQLIGFVNVAWDGGGHAFLLDTTVHAPWQRRGIGRQLVRHAISAACERGLEWLHVDYEPHLAGFYRGCGFQPTAAGLIRLQR